MTEKSLMTSFEELRLEMRAGFQDLKIAITDLANRIGTVETSSAAIVRANGKHRG